MAESSLANQEQGKEPSSYCYDNCSNHGKCVKNICSCDAGWYGENCATSFGRIPLSVGASNLTKLQDLKAATKQYEAILLGISSRQCAKCGLAEDEYANANFFGIPFIRIDATGDRAEEILTALGVDLSTPLPVILFVWDHGKKRGMYRGAQTAADLTRFMQLKGRPPGYSGTFSVESLDDPTMTIVVAFFPSSKENHEDEFEELERASSDLRSRHDIQIFYHEMDLKQKKWPEWYPAKSIALPALGVLSAHPKYITLTEAAPSVTTRTTPSFSDWISLQAVPSQASPLTAEVFSAMEALGLPMLLLFSPSHDKIEPLLPAFHAATREFRGRITFMFDTQGEYKDKMRVLGLSKPHLVSMAMNTRDVGPVPFQEDIIRPESFKRFCMDFLAGRTVPLSRLFHDQASDNDEEEEEDVVGISESFKPTDIGIVDVTSTDAWSKTSLDESLDVVVFVYRARKCKACKQLAPFYKKMCRRLIELKKTSTTNHYVICARVDMDKHRGSFGLADSTVPAIIMLPAFAKSPPFRYFSAVAKVFTIMEWARINAGRTFEWGEDLPQFDLEEKRLFKEQIKQREDSKAAAARSTAAQREDL